MVVLIEHSNSGCDDSNGVCDCCGGDISSGCNDSCKGDDNSSNNGSDSSNIGILLLEIYGCPELCWWANLLHKLSYLTNTVSLICVKSDFVSIFTFYIQISLSMSFQ